MRHFFKTIKASVIIEEKCWLKNGLTLYKRQCLRAIDCKTCPGDFISKWFFWQIRSVTGLIRAEEKSALCKLSNHKPVDI